MTRIAALRRFIKCYIQLLGCVWDTNSKENHSISACDVLKWKDVS